MVILIHYYVLLFFLLFIFLFQWQIYQPTKERFLVWPQMFFLQLLEWFLQVQCRWILVCILKYRAYNFEIEIKHIQHLLTKPRQEKSNYFVINLALIHMGAHSRQLLITYQTLNLLVAVQEFCSRFFFHIMQVICPSWLVKSMNASINITLPVHT